jgi:hypothetical protein
MRARKHPTIPSKAAAPCNVLFWPWHAAQHASPHTWVMRYCPCKSLLPRTSLFFFCSRKCFAYIRICMRMRMHAYIVTPHTVPWCLRGDVTECSCTGFLGSGIKPDHWHCATAMHIFSCAVSSWRQYVFPTGISEIDVVIMCCMHGIITSSLSLRVDEDATSCIAIFIGKHRLFGVKARLLLRKFSNLMSSGAYWQSEFVRRTIDSQRRGNPPVSIFMHFDDDLRI